VDSTLAVQPVVVAQYGLLNNQSTLSDVNAAAGSTANPSFGITVGGLVNSSTVTNDSNAIVAAAYANQASNAMSLDVGSLIVPTGGANVASVTNLQTLGAGSDVTAITESGAGQNLAVSTIISGAATDSTVTASNNAVQTLAYGNRANSNTLAVTANTLSSTSAAGSVLTAQTAAATDSASAAFTVQSVQVGGTGIISATQTDGALSTAVKIGITGVSTNSTLAADANAFTASAYANSSANGLSIDGGSVTTSGGVQNVQLSGQTVSATIGTAGVAGTSRNLGGVLLSVDDAVTNSTLSVSSSTTNGTAVSNSSTNSLSVSATSLTANGIITPLSSVVGTLATSTADFNVSNAQQQTGAATATVAGSYGIDDASLVNTGALAITGSTLKVDANQQQATAQGNTGINSLVLGGTTLTGATASTNLSAAINSAQSSTASVAATSNAELFAPAVVNDSSVSISGNRNVSLANSNEVTNSLTASGNSVAPATATAANGSTALNVVAGTSSTTGALVLNNVQSATGATLQSTATTQVYNEDRGAASTGLLNSTLTIERNVTLSEATSNRATNTATVSATETGTTTVLGNTQANTAAVTSTAKSTVGVTLAGDGTLAAANGSAIALNSNVTSALARGNSASNVLNYEAGATYANVGAAGTSTLGGALGSVAGSAVAMLGSQQSNAAAVSAVATNTGYAVALNAATGPTVNGSSVSLANNTVAATAYGNQVVNRLNLATLGSTPTAAVSSFQGNSSAVTATASTVTYNMAALSGTGTGAISGSTLRSTANAITATAVGNSAVSSIVATR
jgi:hypothetical protein